MHIIFQTQEPINVADSLKAVRSALIEGVKNDPETFIEELAAKAVDFGIKVIAALLIYIVGIWIIRKVKNLLKRGFERKNTEGTLASFIVSLVSIGLTVLLIIITIGALGINTTSLAALLAAGGMAIGMALSGTVQNFAGGIMLLVFKPFKAGDYITAQGYSGTVKSVSIFSTKIVTTDNREVVIPNGALSNGNIDNYSSLPLRRVDLNVSVEYDTDADACIAAIKEIVETDPRVLDSSTEGAADVFVALSSLNPSDITFVVRAWTRSEDYWGVYFDLNKAIYTELPRKGINFVYPHMNVLLKKDES